VRPGLGRLVAVELRKMVNSRAGFWLQVASAAITVIAVIVRSVVGEAADRTFASVLSVGLQPAAVLLPVAGILLVTSEWSQRTGMITFTLVPVPSRVPVAKLVASIVLSLATLVMSVAVVGAGLLVTSPGIDGTWSDAAPLIGQSAVFLATGMLVGVAFGAILLASAPATVVLFALPITWTAVASLSIFSHAAAWLDTRLALAPLHEKVLSATQWAQSGTALALWTLLPLLIGSGGSRDGKWPREGPQPIRRHRRPRRSDRRGARHSRPATGDALMALNLAPSRSSTAERRPLPRLSSPSSGQHQQPWSPLPRPEVVGFSRLHSLRAGAVMNQDDFATRREPRDECPTAPREGPRDLRPRLLQMVGFGARLYAVVTPLLPW